MRKEQKYTRSLILEYIAEYTKHNQFPPTVREITEGVGFGSTSTTHHHMQRLIKEGLLVRQDNRARAIVLAEDLRQSEEA